MKDVRDRLIELAADSPYFGERPRIIAGGFAMDNMKALAFAESEMPLHLVGPDLEDMIADLAKRTRQLRQDHRIDACHGDTNRPLRRIGESRVRFRPRSKRRASGCGPRQNSFHRLLERAVGCSRATTAIRTRASERIGARRSQRPRCELRRCAPIDAFGEIDPNRVVAARRLLTLGLAGYGKYGRSLFNELNLVSPEEAGKHGKSTQRKKEEAQA